MSRCCDIGTWYFLSNIFLITAILKCARTLKRALRPESIICTLLFCVKVIYINHRQSPKNNKATTVSTIRRKLRYTYTYIIHTIVIPIHYVCKHTCSWELGRNPDPRVVDVAGRAWRHDLFVNCSKCACHLSALLSRNPKNGIDF